MRGEVNAFREAVVPLTVRGPDGREADIEATLDTGFTEYLTLTPQVVAALGLQYQDTSRVILGDGSIEALYVYEAIVLWDGQERLILVHETSGGCLIGMALLYGHDLHVQVVDGGAVTIKPLP